MKKKAQRGLEKNERGGIEVRRSKRGEVEQRLAATG